MLGAQQVQDDKELKLYSSLCTLEDMSQIQLVDGNEIFHGQGIFFDIQNARTPEIHDAMPLYAAHHFADAIILRTGTIVHQVAQLDVIIRAPVKGIDDRQSIQSI